MPALQSSLAGVAKHIGNFAQHALALG